MQFQKRISFIEITKLKQDLFWYVWTLFLKLNHFILFVSRNFVTQVSWDTHSKSCKSVLCKLKLKCADLRFSWFYSQSPAHNFHHFSPTRQTELLPRCKDMPSLAEVLHTDGKLLTETILQVGRHQTGASPWMTTFNQFWLLPSLPSQAVGGAAPRSLTEYFSEVLLSLNRHCPALLAQWLKETLQTPAFPSAQVSPEQKHTFSQQLLRSGSVLNHISDAALRRRNLTIC